LTCFYYSFRTFIVLKVDGFKSKENTFPYIYFTITYFAKRYTSYTYCCLHLSNTVLEYSDLWRTSVCEDYGLSFTPKHRASSLFWIFPSLFTSQWCSRTSRNLSRSTPLILGWEKEGVWIKTHIERKRQNDTNSCHYYCTGMPTLVAWLELDSDNMTESVTRPFWGF